MIIIMSQFNTSNFFKITKFDGSYLQVWKHNLKLVLKLEKLLKVVEENELLQIIPLPSFSGITTHIPTIGIGSKK